MIHQLLGWFDNHKKQTVQGATAVVLIGVVVAYLFWNQGQKEDNANRELSKLMNSQANADGFLRLVGQYPNTIAGGNALLMAGRILFLTGRYPEAQSQFQKFRQNYRTSPFADAASLGVAACLDAMGKMDDAIGAYESLIQSHPHEMVVIQCQFALARLYESQNKLDKAVGYYDVVAREDGAGTFGAEAGIRAHELLALHPTLAKAADAPGNLQP